ncbi:MAG TPA: ATP-binding cassette domain-containing protein [Rubrobacteraceae bacterium]|nr:ATP-binding cassette domain-containing protein [Rubrobacteraceae bacterium]
MTFSPKNSNVPSLSLEAVSVRYGGVAALEDVSLAVEPGEQLAVIGASGAGKSTLFRALTRDAPLAAGRIFIGERDLYRLSSRELKKVRRRIGTIYQAYNLVPQLSAGVNTSLGEVGGMRALETLRTFVAGPAPTLSKRVRTALEEVGLGDKTTVRTADLSGGQQQRVAVARLLVQRPDLILADEPFAAVDPVTTERVLETLLRLNSDGATLLVNLHDVEIARRFPRIAALREGRIVFDGPSDTLSEDMLKEIYAGDPGPGNAALPDSNGDLRRRREEQTRLLEGQDGVSAH